MKGLASVSPFVKKRIMNEALNDIANRVKNGERVSPQEYAYLLHNNKDALFAFMIANNPGSMNDILRHQLGYTHELGFRPDVQRIKRICEIILKENKLGEIKTIIDSFKVNLDGLSPALVAALNSHKSRSK